MTFAWPVLLWLLALPAALLTWEIRRKRGSAAVVHPKIINAQAGAREVTFMDKAPVGRGRVRFRFCIGLAFSILALARPQWGRIEEPVFDQSREIILVLDLSRSMMTADVKPSRLDRAKLLIESLLDHLKGERVGLIEFSGTAFLQAPLSSDYEVLREFLSALGPDSMPEGGTNYGALLDTAADSFQSTGAADRFLIILSDGEATDEDWRSHVDSLKAKGIRVIGLGVGTQAGGLIPDGSGGFLKDDTGAVVLSKLESGTLRELAEATGGVYQDASNWVDLASLVKSTVDAAKKGRFVERRTPKYAERFQWALAPALLFLLLSLLDEIPVKPRPRSLPLPGTTKAAAGVAAAMLVFTFARAAPEPEADPAALLSRMVGRLADKPNCDPLDWSELGHETVSWGQHLQTAGQPVPEGPVRDALEAAQMGRQKNPTATDWPALEAQLKDLLKEPPESKKNPPPEEPKDKPPSEDEKKDNDNQPKDSGQNGNSKPSPAKDQPQKADSTSSPTKPSGQNNEKPAKPDTTGGLQKIGAQTQERPDPAAKDPSLVVPLERLQQLKQEDSPAELYQLIQRAEPAPPPQNKGKNW